MSVSSSAPKVSGAIEYRVSGNGGAWNPRNGGEGGGSGTDQNPSGSSEQETAGSDVDSDGTEELSGGDTTDSGGIDVELEPLDRSRSICDEHKDEGIVYAYYREKFETEVAKLKMTFDVTDAPDEFVIGLETSGPFEVVPQGQPNGVSVTTSGHLRVSDFDQDEFDVLVNIESYSSYDPSEDYEITVREYENGSGVIGSTQICSP